MARMLPREAELVLEWTGLPGEESVKRFERSNGLDTALYKKTIPTYQNRKAKQLVENALSAWYSQTTYSPCNNPKGTTEAKN